MKNLKCLFANIYSFLSTARFLNEAGSPKLGGMSQVEGAENVPPAKPDQSTNIEKAPTVSLAIPESKKPTVASETVPTVQLALFELPTVPYVVSELVGSKDVAVAAAAANQKKEEGKKLKSSFEEVLASK